jgi:hypothetical protein
MRLVSKIYAGYCVFMTGYGCSRGYRIENANFTTDRVISGIFNGAIYSIPFLNIEPTIRLLNRLEIKYKNYDKKQHVAEYKEFIGVCMDDL